MTTNVTAATSTAPVSAAEAIVRGVVDIFTAFASRNQIAPESVPGFLRNISQELMVAAGAGVDAPVLALPTAEGNPVAAIAAELPATEAALPVPAPEQAAEDRWVHLPKVPAVAIEDSVTAQAIVCLFDGQPKKMLKRYIRAKFGMEEADYKAFWNLPADYPMVAPGYAAEKRTVAVAQGLGTEKVTKTPRHLRLVESESVAA